MASTAGKRKLASDEKEESTPQRDEQQNEPVEPPKKKKPRKSRTLVYAPAPLIVDPVKTASEPPLVMRRPFDETPLMRVKKQSGTPATTSSKSGPSATPSQESARGSSSKQTPFLPEREETEEDESEEDKQVVTPLTLPPTSGKGKARQRDDIVMEPSEENESDDDDMEFNFQVLKLNTTAAAGTTDQEKSTRLRTSFSTQPYAYFGDHMAPFRGIIAEHKDDPETAGRRISELFRKCAKRKLLATSGGHEFTPETKRAIAFAVEVITGNSAEDIVPVHKSAWAVVTLSDRAGVDKLLDQKVAFDPMRRLLVSFRKPANNPKREKVFEVKNVQNKAELRSLRKWLVEEEKVEIVKEVPSEDEWTTVFTGRVVWRVKAQDATWQWPKELNLGNGNRLWFKQAPTCDTCHSDDHHFTSCPWKTILPDVKFKINENRNRYIKPSVE